MCKISVYIAVILLIATVTAEEKPSKAFQKCLEDNKLTRDEFRTLAKAKEQPENFYCTIKCTLASHKALQDDGKIIIDKVKEIKWMQKLPEDNRKKILECLEKDVKIVTCQDAKKVYDCYRLAKADTSDD